MNGQGDEGSENTIVQYIVCVLVGSSKNGYALGTTAAATTQCYEIWEALRGLGPESSSVGQPVSSPGDQQRGGGKSSGCWAGSLASLSSSVVSFGILLVAVLFALLLSLAFLLAIVRILLVRIVSLKLKMAVKKWQ
jgi:hypothetical protein